MRTRHLTTVAALLVAAAAVAQPPSAADQTAEPPACRRAGCVDFGDPRRRRRRRRSPLRAVPGSARGGHLVLPEGTGTAREVPFEASAFNAGYHDQRYAGEYTDAQVTVSGLSIRSR